MFPKLRCCASNAAKRRLAISSLLSRFSCPVLVLIGVATGIDAVEGGRATVPEKVDEVGEDKPKKSREFVDWVFKSVNFLPEPGN